MGATVEQGFELHGEATPLRKLIADVWRSRSLLVTLAKKDYFVKYRRAAFGTLWAIALPIIQAIVLSVVFTRVARIHTTVNYPTFVFSGLLPWTFFSSALPSAATSIVDGQGLATKIYFPRAILPLASVGASLFAFWPNIGVLIAVALIFGVGIGPAVFLLIPGTVLMVALTAGFGLVFSAAHVYFRDVRYILAASLLAWFWGSAVFFPLSLATGARAHSLLRTLIEINPVTGMVELFRAAIVGGDPGWHTALWFSLIWTVGLLIVGALLHRRFDRVFVDLL